MEIVPGTRSIGIIRAECGFYVLVRILAAAGRAQSCRRSAIWSVCGSDCLSYWGVTDVAKRVVVVLAEQTDPVIVFAVFAQITLGDLG